MTKEGFTQRNMINGTWQVIKVCEGKKERGIPFDWILTRHMIIHSGVGLHIGNVEREGFGSR